MAFFSAASAARSFSCSLRSPSLCLFCAAMSFASAACFCLICLRGRESSLSSAAFCLFLCFGSQAWSLGRLSGWKASLCSDGLYLWGGEVPFDHVPACILHTLVGHQCVPTELLPMFNYCSKINSVIYEAALELLPIILMLAVE